MGIIQFKCQVSNTLPFTALLPFQGGLKKRSEQDIKSLAESLLHDGLKQPLSIWHKPNDGTMYDAEWHNSQPHYVLDGHRRIEAIQWIADHNDPSVLNDEYPVVVVIEDTLEEAKNSLLLMSIPRGHITPKGLVQFVADCPKIDTAKLGIKLKVGDVAPVVPSVIDNQWAVLRLRLPKDKVAEVTSILSGVSFVEIL